jgi:outer membrane protein OmpA-like peptidoglycan-associated protein
LLSKQVQREDEQIFSKDDLKGGVEDMTRRSWVRTVFDARRLAAILATVVVGLVLLSPQQTEARGWGWHGGGWGGGWGWGVRGWGWPGYWGYPYAYAGYPYYPYYPAYGYQPAYSYQYPAPQMAAAPAPAPIVAAVPTSESFRIFFGFNKAHLAEDAMPEVDKAIAAARRDGTSRVEIVGATDTVGTGGYNMALSRKRAEAVRDYMIAHGIAANEITLRGVGYTELLVQTGKDVRERQNRRVDIVVTGSSAQPQPQAYNNAPGVALHGGVVTPVTP